MLILAYNFPTINLQVYDVDVVVDCQLLIAARFSSISPVENNQSKNTKSFMNVLRVFFQFQFAQLNNTKILLDDRKENVSGA